MPPACSICKHPKRPEIDKLLVSGDSYRDVAQRFHVSADALYRHKQKHISKCLASAQQAKEVLRADSLLDQVRAYLEKTDGIFQAVNDDGDYRVALLALREAREYLKLLLEAQGSLQPEGTQRTVVFVYPGEASL